MRMAKRFHFAKKIDIRFVSDKLNLDRYKNFLMLSILNYLVHQDQRLLHQSFVLLNCIS